MTAQSRPFILFITGTLATFAILLVGSVLAFHAQEDTHTTRSIGLCSGVGSKLVTARAIRSPKTLFIGGSATHNGIDTGRISDELGIRAVNFGTFASLGPATLLWEARKVLKPGDTAVLAFEYALYSSHRPSEPEIDFIMGCGREFIEERPLSEVAMFALGADPLRMFQARRRSDAAEVQTQLARITRAGDPAPIDANFAPVDAAQAERMALYRPLPIRYDPESRDVLAIRDFASWADAHGVRVVATWPNTLYFKEYARDPGFAKIANGYRQLGIEVIGQPQDAMVPARQLHDTQYHLNQEGIRARTDRLIPLIRPHLNFKSSPVRPVN